MVWRSVGPERPRSLGFVSSILFPSLLVSVACYAPNPVSIQSFEDCQRLYCDRLAEFFNSPIEWRIVLDISKSYLQPDEAQSYNLASQKVSSLLRTLPVVDGDSFCLDSFSLTYHRGRCHRPINTEWVDAVSAQDDYFTSEIGTLLPKTSDGTKATDFRSSLTEIHRQDLPRGHGIRCGTNPRRRYYLFLTDGKHDPKNRDTYTKLFSPLNPPSKNTFKDDSVSFVLPPQSGSRACPNFGQLVRGLFFVIDASVAKTEVQNNWSIGKAMLAGPEERSPRPSTRPFSPHITIWHPDSGILDPDIDIRAEVDRHTGIYPCLQSDGSARTPHDYRYPNPYFLTRTCETLLSNEFTIALPTSLTSKGSGSINLPYYTLQRGSGTTRLRININSEDPLALKNEKYSDWKETPYVGQSDWVSQRVGFGLDFSGAALEDQRLPVEATYALGRRESTPPVLSVHFARATVSGTAAYVFSQPGLLPILLSSVLLLFFFAAFATTEEKSDKNFTIVHRRLAENAHDEYKEVISVHKQFDRNGVRLYLDGDEGLIAGVKIRTEGTPSSENFCFRKQTCANLLDIIPFGTALYYALWCTESAEPCGGRPLITSEEDINASMYSPPASWIPVPSEVKASGDSSTSRMLVWLEQLRNMLMPLKVRWCPSLNAEWQLQNGETRKHSLEVWLTYQDRKNRFALVFFQIATLSAAIVATLQLWVPALYDVLYERGITGALGLHIVMFVLILPLIAIACVTQGIYRIKRQAIGLVFRRFYLGLFWGLFWSCWFLVLFSWWGIAGRLGAVAVVVLFVLILFLSEKWWVSKRVRKGRSFRILDQLADGAHSLIPFAS